MRFLIEKDLALVSRQVITYLLAGVVIGGLGALEPSTGPTLMYTFLAVSLWNFAARISYLEEKNRTYGFLWTLPCSRSQFVVAKYLAVLVFWLLDVVVFALAAQVYRLIGLIDSNIFPLGTAVIGSTPFLALIGLYLLLVFRSGYIKASMNIRLLFLLFFAPLLVPRHWLQQIAAPLIALTESSAFPFILIGSVTVVYLGLMGMAALIFNRKELNTVE